MNNKDLVNFKLFAVIALLLAAIPLTGCPITESGRATADENSIEITDLGIDAYIYAYSLVTMEMTRRVMTNVAKPDGTRAPMGQFMKAREYPNSSFRDVTAPNADTLYTIAWLDLAREPWILGIPDMQGRYYLMPMLDGWTTVFQVPGKRTSGTGAQKYAITGPGWKGSVPRGVTEYKSPTNIVWILGRIYCTGSPDDYAAVHALQDQFTLVPLSSYGKPYTAPAGRVDPNIDMKTAVRDQVNNLSAAEFFRLFAQLWKTNPPAAADAPIVAKMARIGLVPGQDFDISKLDAATTRALEGVPKTAQGKIMAHFRDAGTIQNGWTFSTKTGIYGTDYLQRAFITAIGLGANRPEDAVYPTSEVDGDGKPYDGANDYVMHFEKGQTPPGQAFWSLTMYDGDYFFVANPLNRYTLSSRFSFHYNPDWSLDFYIQHKSPGRDKESNWLPAPEGKFILMLRLYWPRETPPSILNGTWTIPPVKEVPRPSPPSGNIR
jgi:hypothetical protein